MAVPDYESLMLPILNALADGEPKAVAALRDTMAPMVGVTEEDRAKRIPSGGRLFDQRVHWALTYLAQAGLVRRPRRAVIEITPRGREVLAEEPERVDADLLRRFPELVEFKNRTGTRPRGTSGAEPESHSTPETALGLDRVYVQAKRYAADNAIGRPEIQAFVGALHGAQADRGIFITTSRFTNDAKDYAERVAARLVLIDAQHLGDLMVRHDVGVQAEETFVLKQIDEATSSSSRPVCVERLSNGATRFTYTVR